MWSEYADLEIEGRPIVTYIKNKNGRRMGVLVSGIYNGEVCVGWSLCKKCDEFDKHEGYFLAEDRLKLNQNRLMKYVNGDSIFCLDEIIPKTVMKNLELFLSRSRRYFKENKYSDVFLYLEGCFY